MMVEESVYFDLQASWGITKHLGGTEATAELADICKVGKDTNVLYVGCGVGTSPCYLVKKYGCRLVGIDISEEMVERARKRAKKEGIENRTEFRVADAQELPFKDGTFDAVFCESVLAFVPDRQGAVDEFARVLVNEGYAGFNEVTWLEKPPSSLENYLNRVMGAEFLVPDAWKAFLENAGLDEVAVRTFRTNIWSQWASEVRQFEFMDFVKAWGKYWAMLFTNPATCRFTVEAMKLPRSIFKLFRYFGYGIYTGRKPAV
jgi:arsenite methyltransferase